MSVLYQGSVGFITHRRSLSRIFGSILLGVVVGIAVYFGWRYSHLNPDLYQPWLGAKLMLEGVDPYHVVGPGRQYPHEFLFIYPLTSSVLVLPLAWLSVGTATAVFSGVSAGLLGYYAGFERWPLFLSFPFISAAWGGQWGPLLSAAFLVPQLSFLYWGKPSIGGALLLSRLSEKSLIWFVMGGLPLLALSIAWVPAWPLEWLHAIRSGTSHMTPPVLRPLGFITLFALVKWRRPEARLIALLSLVPQTNLWYEAVPLFLVPKTFRESLILMITTSAPVIYRILTATKTVEIWPHGVELALFAYLPCVVMVLRRANSADA